MIDEEVGIVSLRRSKLSLEFLSFMLEQKKKLEAKRKEIFDFEDMTEVKVLSNLKGGITELTRNEGKVVIKFLDWLCSCTDLDIETDTENDADENAER